MTRPAQSTAAPRKVGVLLDGFVDLSGARDFMVAFVDALNRAKGDREVVLLLRVRPKKSLADRLRYHLGLANLNDLAQETLAPLHAAGMSGDHIEVLRRGDTALRNACGRLGIDVIGPMTKCPKSDLNVPWFGYLYDFQHKHLSALFPAEECQARDKRFGEILSGAYAVVVNAFEVRRDVERFFPGLENKVVPLSFNASPRHDWFDVDISGAQSKYGTGSRYFMVSNQFWLHKNHETVVESFAKLSADHPDINLVFTGDTFDPRSPTRLQDINNHVAGLGLTDRVHILGLVPKLDQIALMRGCIAMIQATSSEGGPGGGSVYDAISLGVPTIVSDIPINREIEHLVSLYFSLNDVSDLAEKMEQSLLLPHAQPDKDDLLAAGAERREKHGHDIWRAIDMAAEAFARRSV